MEELKNKEKPGDVVFTSDKSGKLCLMTEQEYISTVRPHIANDRLVESKEEKVTEDTLKTS